MGDMQVYVIGRQVVDFDEVSRFLRDHNTQWSTDTQVPGQFLCEFAGRVCYMSFSNPRPGGNASYLKHIIECGHGSVLEHCVWTFLVTGVSRSLTHELVRHRAGFSYSQLSQRYVRSDPTKAVEPDLVRADPVLHTLWASAVEQIYKHYETFIGALENKVVNDPVFTNHWVGKNATKTQKIKVIQQCARSLLPNSDETKIVFTANARALRHFIELRGSRDADYEIRKLANKLLEVLQKEAPNIFGDYEKAPLGDGTYEVKTLHRKV